MIKKTIHKFLFRGRLTCKCARSLIGERRKGIVYYRCQNKKCDYKNLKEKELIACVSQFLQTHRLTPSTVRSAINALDQQKDTIIEDMQQKRINFTYQLNQIDDEIKGMTKIYAKGDIERDEYLQIKNELIQKKHLLESEQKKENLTDTEQFLNNFEEFLGLIKSSFLSWDTADFEKKGAILVLIGSDFVILHDNSLKMEFYDFFHAWCPPPPPHISDFSPHQILQFNISFKSLKTIFQPINP